MSDHAHGFIPELTQVQTIIDFLKEGGFNCSVDDATKHIEISGGNYDSFIDFGKHILPDEFSGVPAGVYNHITAYTSKNWDVAANIIAAIVAFTGGFYEESENQCDDYKLFSPDQVKARYYLSFAKEAAQTAIEE